MCGHQQFLQNLKIQKLVSFHQDIYWQLSTNKVVTVWLALTESKEISVAKSLPESYKLGLINNLDVENADDSYQRP